MTSFYTAELYGIVVSGVFPSLNENAVEHSLFHRAANFLGVLKIQGNLQKPKILLTALRKRSLFFSFPLKSGGKLTCRSHSVQTLRKISELIEVATNIRQSAKNNFHGTKNDFWVFIYRR